MRGCNRRKETWRLHKAGECLSQKEGRLREGREEEEAGRGVRCLGLVRQRRGGEDCSSI